jgi:hypothetical protein
MSGNTLKTLQKFLDVFIKDFELKEVQEARTTYEIAKMTSKRTICAEIKPRPKGKWVLDYPNVPGTLD